MNPLSKVGACLVLILALVSCSSEVDGPTTTVAPSPSTTGSEAPTTTAATTTTTSQVPMTTPLPTPTGECFYMKRYVVTPQDGLEGNVEAVDALETVGINAIPLTSVGEVEGFDGSPVAARLDAVLDILDVGSENPLAAALFLNDLPTPIPAGPVYVTGLAGHWSSKPGTDPLPSAIPMVEPTGDLGDGVVAVVDSGLTEPLPDWMSVEHVLRDPTRDMETLTNDNPASHGSFVSSLIRYLAPEHRVGFASTRPVDLDSILGNDHALPPGAGLWSTELHVAEAISRILDMELPDITALNLSLGAYTCDADADPTLITTVAALNTWFDVYPNSTVFAAGGNEVPNGPLWPAALWYEPHSLMTFDPGQIRGVAATDNDGTEVIWQRPTNAGGTITAMKAPSRPWVNNLAPGCDLLGIRGGSETDTVSWSGSSFATAVSAALYARDLAPASTPVIPSDQDYTAVADIWDDQGSCVITG